MITQGTQEPVSGLLQVTIIGPKPPSLVASSPFPKLSRELKALAKLPFHFRCSDIMIPRYRPSHGLLKLLPLPQRLVPLLLLRRHPLLLLPPLWIP